MKASILIVVSAMLAVVSLGGQVTTTGKEQELWNQGGYSVLVATIRDIRLFGGDETDLYQANLLPLATLAGKFDASLNPRLPVRFYALSSDTSIKQVPPDGVTVLAVIQVQVRQGDEVEESNWIVSDICSFMPDYSALVTLRDARDPLVRETLSRLQEARADSGHYRPTTAPSTQP
jgi:hypothetical protein